MQTVIEPRRVLAFHLAIIGGLVLANVPIAIMDGLGHRNLFGYSRLLRMEQEANVPSFFSALALLACAVVAWANRLRGPQDDRDRRAWSLLAAFFAFLAVDEATMLHELANQIGTRLAFGGLLTNVGAFIYVPIVIWLAVRFIPFWLRQESHLRLALFAGGAIYVAGALGFELVENALLAAGFGYDDMPMRISVTLEESGEMLGVAVFLYAFLHRFASTGGGPLVGLAVRDARGGASEPV